MKVVISREQFEKIKNLFISSGEEGIKELDEMFPEFAQAVFHRCEISKKVTYQLRPDEPDTTDLELVYAPQFQSVVDTNKNIYIIPKSTSASIAVYYRSGEVFYWSQESKEAQPLLKFLKGTK